ncbi:NERD domain-containing protein [Clostridium sp. AF46-9NS]|nr:NERD domain-containing protein [Clostridium sp. AF46-9NS]RGF37870.1 NERD domain-containing protein [Clostridium sp. AF46-12NS]
MRTLSRRDLSMAKFIGSDLQSDNWGEDYLIKKMMEYFDDSFVIYRNRPIFGAQFDVCLLAPKIGIIIFEVKAWKSDTIKEVKNGDFIVIKTKDAETGEEGESTENPTSQARGYVYKMRSKIRQKTGKTPLVYDMVAFPNLSKGDYDSKGIEAVCEYDLRY